MLFIHLFYFFRKIELSHQKWITDVQELQDTKVSIPLVVDDRAEVCKKVTFIEPQIHFSHFFWSIVIFIM